MKKLTLCIALVAIAFVANAQNTSKNGHQITPEAGDWGLGIDVDPILMYVGNMFNGTQNNSSPSWNYVSNSPIGMTVTGFMYKDENMAYRAKVRLGTGSNKEISIITKDGSITNPPATVEDELKASASNILLSAGFQKMRGKHRVKGFYGAEILIGSGNGGKTTYDYGNPFNLDSATTTGGYGMATITDWSYGGTTTVDSRTTESKSGSTFYIGLRGFIGVEYFVAPRISIAGEFGWGLGFAATGEGEETIQYFDEGDQAAGIFADDSVKSRTVTTGKSSSFSLDTDSGNQFSSSSMTPSSGSLRMTFFF